MAAAPPPSVPVVDLRGGEQAVDELGRACAEVGFVIITGHGVDSELIGRMQRLALEFFAQPLERKLECSAPEGTDRFKGYVPFDRMATGRSSLIEIFQTKPFDTAAEARAAGVPADHLDEYSGNVWPAHIPGFREGWNEYYAAMSGLAASLFEMIAAFFGAPRGFFAPVLERHVSDLAINFYPAQLRAPDGDQLRAQPHTDFGTLTLLAQDGAKGLQIERDGEWVDVPVIADAFVVNLGELMTPWTNGLWRATLHRVVNPTPELAGTHRLSIAYFHKPEYHAVIECIPGCEGDGVRYPPIVAGEWFDRRRRTEAAASSMEGPG
jgi:isopenicillin N synthase-like dioxygenase